MVRARLHSIPRTVIPGCFVQLGFEGDGTAMPTLLREWVVSSLGLPPNLACLQSQIATSFSSQRVLSVHAAPA